REFFLQPIERSRWRMNDPRRIESLGEKSNRAGRKGARVVRKENRRARFLNGDVPTENRRGRCANRPEDHRSGVRSVRIVDDGDKRLRGLSAWQTNSRSRDLRA